MLNDPDFITCLNHPQCWLIYVFLLFMKNVFIPTMPHDEDPELMLANTGQDQWYGKSKK